MRYLAAFLSLVVASSVPAFAAESGVPFSINVNGQGRVSTRPDMAEINIGVTSQAPTAGAALTANNAAMTQLMSTLKGQGVAEKDILTSSFNVNPEYRSDEPGSNRPPRIVSYRVDNSVQVKVRNLDALGALLDAVVRSGANNINGISFTVAEPQPVLDRARTLAIADAKRKAELYAAAAGVKVGRLLYINEPGVTPPPMPKMYAMEAVARDSSVPVAVGDQTMEATLNLIYALDVNP